MPQRTQLPLIGPTSIDRSFAVTNMATINWMQTFKVPGSKSQIVLEPTPGLVELGTPGNGPCRTPHMIVWKGKTYGVFGDELVQFTPAGAITTVGTLSTLSGTVRMARGRNYLALVDGTNGYTYDETTFAIIADPDFPDDATHIRYMDGFFIVNDPDTDNFFISELEDPTDWNPLSFRAASVSPDSALALSNTESILWILGDEVAEPYYNAEDPDFPYELILNAVQEVGIAAPQSIAESDDGIFWLATTPEGGLFVYRVKGLEGQVISDDGIDSQLAGVTDPTTAYGFIYTQKKQSFYILQLDDGNQTLVYNIKVGAWETRALIDGTGWRIAGTGKLGNDVIGGSRIAARHYRLDLSDYTDATATVIRTRRMQVVHHNNQMIDYHQVVVDIQGGVGNPLPPGDDPQLRLRYSDDHGQTWSSWLDAPLGPVGEYLQRAVYNNLGQGRQRQFEVQCSDPVFCPLLGMYANITVLDD